MSEKEYEIPGYSSRMSSQLYKLQQDGYMCDAVIATNSGIINVHKLVLMASNSPVLVESVKKTEKTGGSICLIDIAADITDVKHFVRALYTGKMHLVPDCMNRLLHISQILKMEEEIKFLEKIKMEFENSSLIDISKEIDLTESSDAGQITTQTDSDKNSLEMEDVTKDNTSEKEDSLSADNVDIKVEVPAYGSGVDIEMQIPGFEYNAEAPSTGIKRERNGDSYQEQGDSDMLESKRQRISCLTTVTDLTQAIDESLPDTESESIVKKDSIVSTQLEGSTCEPSENILSANIIDLTLSPGGSMDEPLKHDILTNESIDGESPSELHTDSLHVSESNVIDLPKDQTVELVMPAKEKCENSGSEGSRSDGSCLLVSMNENSTNVSGVDQRKEGVDDKEVENVERKDASSAEFDANAMSRDLVMVYGEKEKSEKIQETNVTVPEICMNVPPCIVDSSVENSILNTENNHAENVLNVTSSVDANSDTDTSPDVIIVSSNIADNSFVGSQVEGRTDASSDEKKENLKDEKVGIGKDIKSESPLKRDGDQISRQISGVEEISDENCHSMSDISNDELPDSPLKGLEAKKPVEYENVSDYESVSDDSNVGKGMLYETVSDGSSQSVVLIDYDTVSDEGSINKDMMEYEVISECSSLEKYPIEYEVISGDEEDLKLKYAESESSRREEKEKKEDKSSVSSSKRTKCTEESSEELKEEEGDGEDSGSEISMKTLDEEHYNSDDDVAIIRCYKCTANFIDKVLYYDHIKEHERDEFDAYKYRVDTKEDEFDAYNYNMEPPEADEKLYQELLHCDECDENFLSRIAFEDHCSYHKRQKMLDKLAKIEKALDKKDFESDLSSISSFSSDQEPSVNKHRNTSDEFEQHRRSVSRERSITLDFFSSPPREDKNWDHSRFHGRSRSPVSPPSYTVRGRRNYRRRRSSSSETLESIGSLSDERDIYKREHSRERESLSRDSFSDYGDHHHYERSHSYDSFSSGFTSDSSEGLVRKEIEMNLETALEEMVSGIKDDTSHKESSKKKRKKKDEKNSSKTKQSLDTFDWLTSLQNPSEMKMEKQKARDSKKATAPLVSPSSLYGSYTVSHTAAPLAGTGFQGLQVQQAARPITQTMTTPVWPDKQKYPTVAPNLISQSRQIVNSFVAASLGSINPVVPFTPITTVSASVAAPLKSILKNATKSQLSTASLTTATASSVSRQLVSIPTTGPQFVPKKTSPMVTQTVSRSGELQSEKGSSSSILSEQQKSTQDEAKPAEILSTLGPVIIPKPVKPTKWPINLSATSETLEETETSETLGESCNPNAMFFELTKEEEEQKRTEIRKARMQLLQKLKHAKGEEKVQLQKEIQRMKVLVHKLYHKLIKCPTCTFHTRDPREYNRHQRVRCHNLLVCHHCDLTFATQEGLQDHLGTHKKIDGVTTERLLEVKLEAFTRDGKSKSSLLKCKECSFTTKWRHSLTRHKRIHDNTYFRCEMCPSKYLSKSTLNEHVKLKHGDGLVCDHCSKVFGSREGLRLHLIAAKGEYKFQCEVCQKFFTNRTHYNGHLNLHRNYRPFECTKCGKAFFLKGSMKKHWDSCGKGTLYLCDLCGIKFASSDSLRNHNLGKHSSKRFICDTCGKTYNWAASYYRHACFKALKCN